MNKPKAMTPKMRSLPRLDTPATGVGERGITHIGLLVDPVTDTCFYMTFIIL
jgi:hypothetical protein